jgi:MoaE-MoaD fusion protein
VQVKVRYFGMMKEIAGRDQEVVELGDGIAPATCLPSCSSAFPKLDAFRGSIALAVNLEYSDGKTVLRDNDEVALIPPVSGGAITDGPLTAETTLPLISGHAQIVSETIHTAPILAAIKRPEDGAVAIFDGIVRDNSRGRRTLYLDYTAYEPMALARWSNLPRRR